jgi:hypothetical protein
MTDKTIVLNLIKSSKRLDAVTITPLDDQKTRVAEMKSITTTALNLAKKTNVSVVLIQT